jgi:mono/diheme cytochrome c family protein
VRRRSFGMICCLSLFASTISLPITLAAQFQQSRPPSSAAIRTGEGLFLQNCALCHLPHKAEGSANIHGPGDDPKSSVKGTTIGPELKGLFRGETPMPEEVLRNVILRGFPDNMPGFRYDLEPKEIDSIIAYLKSL